MDDRIGIHNQTPMMLNLENHIILVVVLNTLKDGKQWLLLLKMLFQM